MVINITQNNLFLFLILALLASVLYAFGDMVLQSVFSFIIFASFYFFNKKRLTDFFSPYFFVGALFLLGFFIRPILVYFNGDFYRDDWGFNHEEVLLYSSLALFYAHVGILVFLFFYCSN